MTTTTASFNKKTKASLPAWKVIWRVIVYRRDLWLANWLAMMITTRKGSTVNQTTV